MGCHLVLFYFDGRGSCCQDDDGFDWFFISFCKIIKITFKIMNPSYFKPLSMQWGFPGGSGGKESACHVGNLGLIPGLGRSHGGRHDSPL